MESLAKRKLKNRIKQIQKCMDKAEKLFITLPDDVQNEILQMHNLESSLNHCIRWGQQAADKLANEDFKHLVRNIDKNYTLYIKDIK